MSLNTTPRTWVSGATLTAAQMNTEVRDALTGVQAAWSTYVPTTTGITVGSGGVVTGRSNQMGKTVECVCTFTFGTGSAITGTPSFTLPVTALSTNWSSQDCNAFDTSASAWWPVVAIATTTTVLTCRTVAGANYIVMSSTVPFTWATGDILSVYARYEAA